MQTHVSLWQTAYMYACGQTSARAYGSSTGAFMKLKSYNQSNQVHTKQGVLSLSFEDSHIRTYHKEVCNSICQSRLSERKQSPMGTSKLLQYFIYTILCHYIVLSSLCCGCGGALTWFSSMVLQLSLLSSMQLLSPINLAWIVVDYLCHSVLSW